MSSEKQKSEVVVPSLKFGDDDFDVEIYNDVARSARLREVKLINTDFKFNASKSRLIDEDEETKKDFGGECKRIFFDSDLGVIVTEFEWRVVISYKNTKPLRLKANYIIVHSELEGKDNSYVRLYAEKLSKFTSYPYFRVIFSTLTSAAGLSLPPLPTLTDRVD